MCDVCGDGGRQFKSEPSTPERFAEVHALTIQHIMDYGLEVRFIFPDPDDDDGSAFFYTVGRNMFNRPELLLTGSLAPEMGQSILNDIADQDTRRKINVADLADSGTPVRVENFTSELKFAWCDPVASEMTGACEIAGTDEVPSIQVIWPDADGRWPDDPGFSYGPDAQPIYPLRSTS